MSTTVKKLIAKPAVCGFDVILNLTNEQIKEKGLPEYIRKWGWYSVVELRDAVLNTFNNYRKGTQYGARDIHLSDFVALNIPANQFSWFINIDEGILQTCRSPEACPFGDDLLYVPAGWGDKVTKAVTNGFCRVKAVPLEDIVGSIRVDAFLADGTRRDGSFLL